MTRTDDRQCSGASARHERDLAASRHYDSFVIGAFRYPHGDASSQRLLALAQAIAESGKTPIVVNDGDSHAPEGYQAGAIATARGIDYICLAGPSGGRLRRLGWRALRAARLARTIVRLRGSGGASRVVLASGLCTPGVLSVLRLALRLKVIVDVVERHDAAQFANGRCTPYFVRHRFTSWLSGRSADRLIVISSALARRYSKMKPPPVMIPAIVDISEYPAIRHKLGSVVTFLYIGNPVGKDRLGVVLDALAQLAPSEQRRLRLVIAGCDAKQLAANPDVGRERLDRLSGVVDALGFVSRSQVLQLLEDADFTVLVRPAAGYADAGFPTKVSESLAAGCPIFGNLTSDLGDYLVDGYNSVICKPSISSTEVSVASIRGGLSRILAMSDDALGALRVNARASASRLSTTEWAPRIRIALEETT